MRKTNQAGIDLIKHAEGLALTAYKCPADVWTIGYGHTSAAGTPTVKEGVRITEAQAERILKDDLKVFEKAVESLVTAPLTDNQFAALVSFTFNVGKGAFSKSTLLKKINANDPTAKDEFIRWNKSGGKVLPGLVKRRKAEAELWGKP